MASTVAFERQSCGKALVTLGADERPLASMLAHVVQQVEAPVESQAAIRAALDTLRVAAFMRYVHVVGQPTGPAELLAALLALVRLHGGTCRVEVRSHVQADVHLGPKTLEADVASEGGCLWMLGLHVACQDATVAQNKAAHVAWNGLVVARRLRHPAKHATLKKRESRS